MTEDTRISRDELDVFVNELLERNAIRDKYDRLAKTPDYWNADDKK